MLVFKPCENFLLLLPPKFLTSTATTNSKPHYHHYHDVKLLLHFPPLKAHFKSTLSSSSSSPLSSPAAAPSEEEEDSSSSSLLTTTVDFLMDSGGLSYEQAQQVIRQLPTLLRNGGRKPRSVIAYFESIGFSKIHISKTISKFPKLLVSDVEKTLKPKIQLLHDIQGFSESEIAEFIASRPDILHRDFETHIKPGLDLIRSFVKTDEDLIKTIKRSGLFYLQSTYRRKWIEPNMDVLRQHGVPDSEIVHFIESQLPTLMCSPKVFKSIVERIVSLGFKPETRKFLIAVYSMTRMKKATWDSKIDLLKGLDWSEVQILDAFRRYPRFLTMSRENLEESIRFFKESLNWDASVLSQRPIILNFSLKTRVIPRYAVLKCLMSKEIIIKEEDKLFVSMLNLNETDFLSKYVFKYQDQLPYLYEEVYKKEYNGEISNQQDHGDVDMTV